MARRALDEELPIRRIVDDDGKEWPYRPRLRVAGATVTDEPNEDDPEKGTTVVTPTGGGGEGSGDIEGVTAGAGLTGGGTAGAVTLAVAAADATIVVNADSIQAGVMQTANLADGGVAEAKLGTGSVTNTKLGASSVTTAKIGDVQVTAAKIADGAIDAAAKIANGVVSLAKLANIATARFLGRTTAGAGAVEELTATQATAMLDEATTSLKGLLSAAFWQLLNGATDAATASALMRRDASADVAVRRLAVTDQINASSALTFTCASHLTASATGNCALSGTNQASLVGGNSAIIRGGGTLDLQSASSCAFGTVSEQRIFARWLADSQTTNATTTTAATQIAAARGGKVKRIVRARTSTASASWTFYYDARLLSGSAAWTGGDAPVAVDFAADAALAACQCELDLSGTSVRSRVTGIAATTIDWSDTLEDCT